MLVMKYGGTSVKDADAVRRLLAHVEDVHAQAGSDGVVIVVSALAKVTDTLLEIAAAASTGSLSDVHEMLEQLRIRHQAMVSALVRHHQRKQETSAWVDREFADLRTLADVIAALRELPRREHDVVAAAGELLSSRIIAAAAGDAGLPAEWVDARRAIVTTDDHPAAQPLMGETQAQCADRIAPLVQTGCVVVIGGYVGATRGGETTTLGRGGSDFSASIFAACLGASELQIFTDVDGMLTADPRLVPGGRVVPELSFDEASELAYFGAKVLHPSTILPAMQRGIPVRILNAARPRNAGTRITASIGGRPHELAAIACKRGVTKIDIASTRMLMAWGFLSRVFAVFEKHRTPVDVVTTSEVAVSLTVDDRRRLADIMAELSAFAEVSVVDDMAIVCAVGESLRTDAALGTRVLGALDGFALDMVSVGGSRKNITVVVPDSTAVAAMTRLHERFFSGAAAETTAALSAGR